MKNQSIEIGQSVWIHCVEKYKLKTADTLNQIEYIVTDVNKSSFYAAPKDKPTRVRRFDRRTWKHDTGIGSYYKASREKNDTRNDEKS